MINKEQTTQQRILQAARNEFMRLGFQDSSLRSIVKAAGVTTGALYGYYPDKLSLFDALVQEKANTLYEKYLYAHESFFEMPVERQISDMGDYTQSSVWECFDYIYEHFDTFKLLICRAKGTPYENYLDSLAKIEEDSSCVFFDCMDKSGRPIPPIPDDLNHMLASAYLTGFFEIVAHDMPKEAAREYVRCLTDFFTAGWMNLLGLHSD